jgi:hypothetical protein
MKATFLTNVLRGKTSVLTAMALAAMVASASAQSVANSSFSSITTTNGNVNSQEITNTTAVGGNPAYTGAIVTGWTNGAGDYNIAMIAGATNPNVIDDGFRASDFSMKGNPFAGSAGNFVALDSDFPTPSTLINPFSSTAGITGLTAGDTYTLSFRVATDEQSVINGVPNTATGYDETLTVNIGGIGGTNTPFTLHYTDANAGLWSTESINFLASSGTEALSFLANGGPAGIPSFILIDGGTSVTLFSTPGGTVPEPGSLALFATGLLGLGSVVRSRFKK